MLSNRFQDALAGSGAAFGHMIMEFGTRGIAQLVEAAGADFAVVDMEHSGFGTDRIADLMAWFRTTVVAPFVRIPQAQYHFIARALDAGAMGIMAPNVETPDEARELVRAAKYPPWGNRGVGLGTAHTGYRMPNPAAYLEEANARTAIICQIESPLGVSNAAEIAAIEGVDCLWVGHFDLSCAMGIPGQLRAPEFIAALETVVAVARSANKVAGAQPGTPEQAHAWWDLGFRVLSWRSDIALYRIGLEEGIQNLRGLKT